MTSPAAASARQVIPRSRLAPIAVPDGMIEQGKATAFNHNIQP